MDFNNEFLNEDLQEDIYMVQPAGFEYTGSNGEQLVYKLLKALYGLKQAPKAWYEKLKNFLEQLGFHSSQADMALFVRIVDGNRLFLFVYVDDIVITRVNQSDIDGLVGQLHEAFVLKDLGDVNFYLELEATLIGDKVQLSQKKYVHELLQFAGMADCKPLPTTMVPYSKALLANEVLLSDPSKYKSIVSKLQYLYATRPDITFSVN